MSTPRAGFIGLGSMGAPIARRLARSGFAVIGCDNSPEMLAAFDEPGTETTSDPIETAGKSELLGICVRTDDQLESVAGDGRLFEALGQGGTVILHSTVSPELAQKLAAKAREYGVGFVDVGVSGGGPAAIEGQLSLYVGAEPEDLERARPWLEAIGKNLAHLGPVGRGQEGKLLNNLISIANYGMSAAIVDIGVDMGFDRQQLIDAFMAGSAQSFALRVGPGMVLPREGTGATGSIRGLHDLLKKDVDHCRELEVRETTQLAGLLASCDVMLARLRRAAAEAEGKPAPADRSATVDAYFAAVRAKDIDAWMALFAEDATYALPNGQVFEGKAAIREFQTMVFGSGSPFPNPGGRFVGSEGIAAEIEAQLPDGSVRHTTNHYRFDDEGKIRSLTVYMRG
ncbi:nuclear transport factor 2 family protein [Novosphingobium sp. G106]|uniref:NAD(P)-binding domain-containing protein n=1 Tax=Novosphingobium sp. G106 TaxID=2849500 RepID=UPI001C2DC780|nr:NAD(P)-binding domain-containing protein [Novosphingobium sp. G106]MBV1686823.1 nuclear transport factor 2 family protein [Novosphingobium sp. G106]